MTIYYPGGAIALTAGLVIVAVGVLAIVVTNAAACMFLMMRGR